MFSLHIGMRNLKTAFATTLCALLYFLIDRNPAFACIGVIFGIGSDMEMSKLNGGNRFFGTLIGGVIGMILFHIYLQFYPQGGYHLLLSLLLFIGVILHILTCVVFKWPGGVQPGGVMLCILLFSTPAETYITYSTNRIIDTGVGVLIALAINYLFPRDRVLKLLHKTN